MTTALRHAYTPRGAARSLRGCRVPELVISGPAGTGKSRACLEKLATMCMLNPGMAGLIVRKTATSLTSTALATFTKKVIPELLGNGGAEWYGGSAQKPAGYRFANGSFIGVGGMDKASKIMSSEWDVIFVQEATELTLDDWQALTTRLRNGAVSFQQIMGDCNPDSEKHWLYQRCQDGTAQIMYSSHQDNPLYYDDRGNLTEQGRQYMAILDALTGVRRLRLRDGKWVSAEGVIYGTYDPAVNLVDRFEIPADWARYWVVDFGYKNPFVLQWWAQDPDGRLYRYREIYRTHRLVDEHARDALDCVTVDGRWTEPKPERIICDHDAEGRATLEKALGLSTHPARKSVTDGIQKVEQRWTDRRLFLMRDSLVYRDPYLDERKLPACTEEEIGGYVWDAAKEKPVKENDHGMDTTRYLVANQDLGTEANLRWL